MKLSGWGRHPRIEAEILTPSGPAAVGGRLAADGAALIPRGAGCSYGDSALAATVLSSRYLDNFLEFDRPRLRLRCGAGLTLGEILELIVPHSAFLPVLPGTRFVTVGGAIAADIHGKNHHIDGSFCDHVSELRLALADGEIVRCSRTENAELFAATCGGMGLTGVVLEATLELMPIVSPLIHNRTLRADNLEDCLTLLVAHRDSKYAVAWIDCLSRGDRLGRGLIYLGEHADEAAPLSPPREGLALGVPFATPGLLLNRYSIKVFNALYYHWHWHWHRHRHRRRTGQAIMPYDRYFFPLDRLRHWNRLYGRRGFLQYQ
ncbi:MAG: FAD-binding oxidoreductase, partial [Pseudohongiellaceae bacterium]